MTTDGIGEEGSTRVNEICTSGDVIFVLGPEKKKVRVSSAVLRNASGYFKALFGPHFSEGQGLSKDAPKEIPMPEEDAQSLEIMFNILHLRNEEVPRSPKPAVIFKVAVAADKFDCIVALQHAGMIWLVLESSGDGEDIGHLMAAAYILDNAQAFDKITHRILMQHKGSFLTLLDGEAENWIPDKTLILLEERRTELRTKLQQLIFDEATAAERGKKPPCSCQWSSRYCLAYLQLMRKGGIIPYMITDISVMDLIKNMEQIDIPDPLTQYSDCTAYYRHQDPKYKALRGSLLEELRKRSGLCLDCLRSQGSDKKEACRVPHS